MQYVSCQGCKKLIPHNPMANVYGGRTNEVNIDGFTYCWGCAKNIIRERGLVEDRNKPSDEAAK